MHRYPPRAPRRRPGQEQAGPSILLTSAAGAPESGGLHFRSGRIDVGAHHPETQIVVAVEWDVPVTPGPVGQPEHIAIGDSPGQDGARIIAPRPGCRLCGA